MKYIVIELQTNADSTVGNIVNTYSSREEADARYHTILAAAAISEVPVHAAVLMTSNGNALRNECYRHKAAELPDTEES